MRLPLIIEKLGSEEQRQGHQGMNLRGFISFALLSFEFSNKGEPLILACETLVSFWRDL